MNLHDRDITRKAFAEGKEEGEALGFEKGISQGAEQKAIETAKKLLKDNFEPDVIQKYTGLPLEKIADLQKEIG